MSEQWFCYIGDREYGPFTAPQLREFVAQGRLLVEHFVRPSSSDQWLPAGQVPGLFPVPPAAGGGQEVPLARPAPTPPGRQPTPPSADQPMSRRPASPMAPVGTVSPAVPQHGGEVPLAPVQRADGFGAPAAAPLRSGEAPVARPPGPAGFVAPAARAAPSAPVAAPVPASRLPAVPTGPVTTAPSAAGPVVRPGWPAPVPVGAVPVGAVPAGPATAVPLTAGLPVGTAVAPPGGSSYAAAVPAARGAPPNPERSELRRKRAKANAQQLLLTVGLAGAGLFVLGILVVVAVIYSGPPKERPARAPAAHAAGKKPKGKPAGESNSTAQRGALAELKGVDLATMSIWMDASKQSGGGVKNVARILFSRAWRTGGSVRPAVIVELRVQNTSGESLTLRPWHAELQPTNSTAAIAIDDDNRPIAPASSAARSAPRQLRPNETVTEQLAFELPADHSSVRLVVPFAAFGQNGQIGFKIPAAAIQGSGISASPGGLGQQRGFGVGPAEPLLELKVDGELPVVTPPDTQGGLPEMSRPAENPDAPAEQAPKKEGGGEDDEDLGGMMNEDEKPAPEAP